MTKWPRCICKPESDWDDDQNYTVETQTVRPSNVKMNDQENFWNGKAYEKSTGP